MDSLNYKYNRDEQGRLLNNQLTHVRDAVSGGNYAEDIDDQPSSNFAYDKTGNLRRDYSEAIIDIQWTVYGKLRTVVGLKNGGSIINYGYDAAGNRTFKNIATNSNANNARTYYVRDAQGNTMAVYTKKDSEPLRWVEQHLYGSSRLGMWNWDTLVPASPMVVGGSDYLYDSVQLGKRSYELSNHLGNVLSVISDKKVGNDSSGVVNYYIAEVLSQDDYYPFGMGMVGRKFRVGDAYRYGFNGKENDNEVKGEGNQQDYGMRIYDPRLGRFLSVDPLTKDFPWYTPYQFAGNKVIWAVDLDGQEECPYHKASFNKKNAKGEVVFEMLSEDDWNAEMSRVQRAEQGWFVPKKDASFLTKMSMGFSNSILAFVGAATEAPAQLHYGDKIKSENKATTFPITGDGNAKRLIAEGLVYLPKLVKTIYNNPSDGEAWGELAGFLFLGRMGKSPLVSKTPKYMSGRFIIGNRTVSKITKHLESNGFATDAGNIIMMDRLRKIAKGEMKATQTDINFARHELREFEMRQNGYNQEQAHHATLQEQGMYHNKSEQLLYTEEALKASNEQWEKEIKKK